MAQVCVRFRICRQDRSHFSIRLDFCLFFIIIFSIFCSVELAVIILQLLLSSCVCAQVEFGLLASVLFGSGRDS